MDLFFVFILGCIFGSFLGVLVDRLPKGKQLIFGRSACDKCHHILSPLDLIPVVSYVVSGAKCRYCKTALPMYLLQVELCTGLVFVITYLYALSHSLFSFEPILLLIIFFCLEGIFFTDWLSGIIPDEFNIIIGLATLFLLMFFHQDILVANLVVGILTLLFFLVLFLVTRGRGMGFGDVKLAFLLGFFLGSPNIILALYVAFLTAAAVSVILILLKKKKLKGDTIAFGPFLIIGTLFAFFFANQIISAIF